MFIVVYFFNFVQSLLPHCYRTVWNEWNFFHIEASLLIQQNVKAWVFNFICRQIANTYTQTHTTQTYTCDSMCTANWIDSSIQQMTIYSVYLVLYLLCTYTYTHAVGAYIWTDAYTHNINTRWTHKHGIQTFELDLRLLVHSAQHFRVLLAFRAIHLIAMLCARVSVSVGIVYLDNGLNLLHSHQIVTLTLPLSSFTSFSLSFRSIRIVTVVYLHHIGAKGILDQRKTQHFTYDPDDPLQSIKVLGLNLGKMSKNKIMYSTTIHCTACFTQSHL